MHYQLPHRALRLPVLWVLFCASISFAEVPARVSVQSYVSELATRTGESESAIEARAFEAIERAKPFGDIDISSLRNSGQSSDATTLALQTRAVEWLKQNPNLFAKTESPASVDAVNSLLVDRDPVLQEGEKVLGHATVATVARLDGEGIPEKSTTLKRLIGIFTGRVRSNQLPASTASELIEATAEADIGNQLAIGSQFSEACMQFGAPALGNLARSLRAGALRLRSASSAASEQLAAFADGFVTELAELTGTSIEKAREGACALAGGNSNYKCNILAEPIRVRVCR